jgi:tRNA (Thr-GGU) A37 N-methylase
VYLLQFLFLLFVVVVDHHICLCVPLHKHCRTGIFPVRNSARPNGFWRSDILLYVTLKAFYVKHLFISS